MNLSSQERMARYYGDNTYHARKCENYKAYHMLDTANNRLHTNIVLNVATLGLHYLVGKQVQKLAIATEDLYFMRKEGVATKEDYKRVGTEIAKRTAIVAGAALGVAAVVAGSAALLYFGLFAAPAVPAAPIVGKCIVLVPKAPAVVGKCIVLVPKIATAAAALI